MNENLKIYITGTLNTGATIGEINTAIKGIQQKINTLNLKVNLDNKSIQAINNFSKQISALGDISKKTGKVIEESLLPDGTKVKRTYFDGLKNEFSQIVDESKKVKTSLDSMTSGFNTQKKQISDLTEGYTKLVNEAKKYDKAGNLKGTTSTYVNDKGNARVVRTDANNQVVGYKDIDNISKFEKAQKSLRTELIELARTGKYTNEELKKIGTGITTASSVKQLDQLAIKMDSMKFGDSLKKEQDKLRESLKKLYDQGKVNEGFFKAFNKVIDGKKNVEEIKKVGEAFERVSQSVNNKSLQQKLLSDAQTLARTSAKTVDKQSLSSLVNDLKNVNIGSKNAANSLKGMESQLKSIRDASKDVAHSSMGMMDAFKTALVKYPVWLAATSLFIGIPRVVKGAIDTIVELDTKLVDLQKVMSADTNFENIMRNASDSAKEFGKTLSETMDSYTEFARQGFDQKEIPMLADAALITSNVGEMEAGQAAEYLTSALIQMKLEAKDAMSVIDSWNSVSNQNATTVEKLAQGYSKAASVASVWKMDMHELNAVIGTVTAATKQSGAEVGNFIKSSLPRLTSQPAGDALDMVGVSLTDQNGNLKSALQIYREVSKEFVHLDDISKSIVAEGLGGKYHIARMTALLTNMDMVDKMMKDSENSSNSARIENEKYMQSLQARINETKNSFQELALAVGDAFLTDTFVAFLAGMKGVAGAVSGLTKTVGGLPIIFGMVASSVLLMNKNFRASVVEMGILKASSSGLALSFKGLGLAFKGLLASTGVGLAFAVIGFAIEKVIGKIGEAKQAAEDYDRKNKEITMSFKDNKDSILSLSQEYSELEKVMKSGVYSTQDLEDYNRVTKELAALMPSLVIGEDQHGNKILASSEYIKTKTEQLEKQLAIQEKIDAQEAKKQAKDDYDTAKDNLKDYNEERKKYLESLQSEIVNDVKRKSFSWEPINIKELDFKSIDEVKKRLDQLYEKKDTSGLSNMETAMLEALQKAYDGYDKLSLKVEDAKGNMSRASVEMMGTLIKSDETMSGTAKSMVSDISMFVASSEAKVGTVDKIFGSLGDKIQSNSKFKKNLEGYAKAVDEYKAAMDRGLSSDGLEEYQRKAKEAYAKIRNDILSMAKKNGLKGEDYSKLASQLDSSANSSLNLKQAVDLLAKSTGKTSQELMAELAITPQLADSMDGLSDSTDSAADSQERLANPLSSLVEKYKSLSDEISPLNGLLEDLANGKKLTAAEAMNLIEKENGLVNAISIENGMVKVNVKAIETMRDAKISSFNDTIEAKRREVLASAEALQTTLKHNKIEIQSIKNVATAQLALAQIKADRDKKIKEIHSIAEGTSIDTDYHENEDKIKGIIDALNSLDSLSELATSGLKSVGTQMEKNTDSTKKNTDSTKKNKDATESQNKAYENSKYVADRFRKALDDVNLRIQKQNDLQSRLTNHSKQYQKSLKDEIELIREKKKILQSQANDLEKQIKSGKIKETGVVTSKSGDASVSLPSTTTSKAAYTGKYAKEINAASKAYNIDPYLIASIIKQESGFNPNAKSSAGASGLMQLMPATAKSLGVKNVFNASQNIMGGTKYIAQQLKAFGGDIRKALAAYNAGPGNVRKYGGIPPFKETQNYVKKVMNNLTTMTKAATVTTTVSTPSTSSANVANYYLKGGFKITDKFDTKRSNGTTHEGLDLAIKAGTDVKALRGGKVLKAYYSKTGGNMVVVQQDDGKVAEYMHMQNNSLKVKAGQTISAGTLLGKVGNTGDSNGNHLHLYIKENGKKTDPLDYLKQLQSDTSKAVAETEQSIDNAQSDLTQLLADISSTDAEIQQLRTDLIDAYIVETDYNVQLKDTVFEKLSKTTYGMDTTTYQYRDNLAQQRQILKDKQVVIADEDKKIRNLLKTTQLTLAEKEKLQNKLNELYIERYNNASARDALTQSIINSQMDEYSNLLDDVNYKLEKNRSLRNKYVKDSKEYVASIKEEKKLIEDQKRILLEEVNSLTESLYKQAMTNEMKKEIQKQINDAMLQYYQLGDSVEQIRSEQIDSVIEKLKRATEIEMQLKTKAIDKEIDELQKAYDKRIKLYDDDLKAFEKTINAKLRLIDDQYNEDTFNKELGKLQDEELAIQKRINILSMSDDKADQAKRVELTKQLTDIQEQIADKKYSREVEQRKQNLNDIQDQYQEEIDAKKDAETEKFEAEKERLEDSKKQLEYYYNEILNDETRWNQLRQDMMQGNLDEAQIMLEDYLNSFSSYNRDIIKEIEMSWSELQSFIESIKNEQAIIPSIGGGSTGSPDVGKPGSSDSLGDDADDKISAWQKYLSNKRKYDNSSAADKKKLAAENAELRSKYNFVDDHWAKLQYLDITKITSPSAQLIQKLDDWYAYLHNKKIYAKSTDAVKKQLQVENAAYRKKWNFPDGAIEDLEKMKIYHEGGLVGDKGSRLATIMSELQTKKPNESIIKALNGELMIPEKNLPNFINNINQALPAITMSGVNLNNPASGGDVINLNIDIKEFNGTQREIDNFSSSIMNDLKKLGKR